MKNGRWVRIYQQDQEHEMMENVMSVVAGDSKNQATVTYTANTRTIEKAVYWLLRYMGCSKAEKLYEHTHEEIEKAAATTDKDSERLEVSGENWSCTIEKLEKNKFKVSMDWAPEIEPLEFPVKKKKASEKTVEKQEGQVETKDETVEKQEASNETKVETVEKQENKAKNRKSK